MGKYLTLAALFLNWTRSKWRPVASGRNLCFWQEWYAFPADVTWGKRDTPFSPPITLSRPKLFHLGNMGEERGAYRVLVGKPEGKRPLGRPRHRWVDNIRMDLQEVGCGHVDLIGLAQERDGWRKLVNAVMNLQVP